MTDRAQRESLVKAAKSLAAEVRGVLSIACDEISDAVGSTNVRCLLDKADEATRVAVVLEALAASSQPSSGATHTALVTQAREAAAIHESIDRMNTAVLLRQLADAMAASGTGQEERVKQVEREMDAVTSRDLWSVGDMKAVVRRHFAATPSPSALTAREVGPQTLHERAVSDRDLRPWRYYRLEYDDLRGALDRYAAAYGRCPESQEPPAPVSGEEPR